MAKLWTVLAAVNGFLAVACGAFGAHGLKRRLDPHMLSNWDTASRYQMYHALALLGVAALAHAKGDVAAPAGWAFVAGVALFSGSLYVMALTGITRLGMVTPLGGLALLAGWALLARAALA